MQARRVSEGEFSQQQPVALARAAERSEAKENLTSLKSHNVFFLTNILLQGRSPWA
jgi:hypothetical protein